MYNTVDDIRYFRLNNDNIVFYVQIVSDNGKQLATISCFVETSRMAWVIEVSAPARCRLTGDKRTETLGTGVERVRPTNGTKNSLHPTP